MSLRRGERPLVIHGKSRHRARTRSRSMKSFHVIALAPLAIVVAAEAPPAASQSQSQPSAVQTDYYNQGVCQKQEVTGSRLATKRVCKTRAEWAREQLSDRQDLEKLQVQRGIAK